jgi:hypothetical protein
MRESFDLREGTEKTCSIDRRVKSAGWNYVISLYNSICYSVDHRRTLMSFNTFFVPLAYMMQNENCRPG